MPQIKSAKKALRQNIRRRRLNLERDKKFKETVRHYRKLIEGKKIAEARKYLPQVYQVLDKLAKVNFIHKNKAWRLKSRLAKKLKSK